RPYNRSNRRARLRRRDLPQDAAAFAVEQAVRWNLCEYGDHAARLPRSGDDGKGRKNQSDRNRPLSRSRSAPAERHHLGHHLPTPLYARPVGGTIPDGPYPQRFDAPQELPHRAFRGSQIQRRNVPRDAELSRSPNYSSHTTRKQVSAGLTSLGDIEAGDTDK